MKLLNALALSTLTFASSAFAAPPEKVGVCHFSEEEGTFHLITIASPAVSAHLAHGDVLAPAAGTTATGTLGDGTVVTLDENCGEVAVGA